jgi:adenosylmethionine-8-amino-7-oxononanoate aminotransferase
MNKGIFVLGTDTGVGKTFVAAGIIGLLRNHGIKIGVMKPVESGVVPGQLTDTDILIRSAGITRKDVRYINPYKFSMPLAPLPAAETDHQVIDIEKIVTAYGYLIKKYEFVVVEGAGGLIVPIKKDYTTIDLIKDLNLPVLIVARAGLGTINHTCLTVNQCRMNGITVVGVIMNGFTGTDISEKTNPTQISNLTDVKILGRIPVINQFSYKNKNWELQLARTMKPVVNIKPIIELIKKNGRVMDYEKTDKKYVWHPFTQMREWVKEPQVIIESGKGNYLTDIAGRRYFDGVSSLWVNVHGHRKKEINTAIVNQVGKISHSTLLGLGNIPSIELAKQLVQITPAGLTKVFYSDNGSTSVEIALKISFQYWQQHKISRFKQKTRFVSFVNAYHGDTIGSVSVGGMDLFHEIYKPLLFNTIKVPYPYCYRCETAGNKCQLQCFSEFERVMNRYHDEIAGVIIEPLVQAAAGMLVSPKGFLRKVRQLTKKNNVLLIVDEVATGFGRTGKMFACDHENIQPDLLCLSKSITGGYLPLAATLTTDTVYSAFLADYADKKTFFHGHTYTGNPVACAAALANLSLYKKENIIDAMQPKIRQFHDGLNKFSQLTHVGDIRQQGMMIGIELVKNKKTQTEYSWHDKTGIKVCNDLRSRGVILRPLGNVIVVMPPLSITKAEINLLLRLIYDSIKKVTE